MTKELAHQIIKNYLKTHSLPNKDCDVWVGETKYTWIYLLKLCYNINSWGLVIQFSFGNLMFFFIQIKFCFSINIYNLFYFMKLFLK